MPIYERCGKPVLDMGEDLLERFEEHMDLITEKVRIDYVFAMADVNDDGQKVNDAITRNGVKCLGLCRKIGPKDRALGRGDAEITLDADWWANASTEEQEALLDHELHHISIAKDKDGCTKYADDRRPVIKLRKHDVEVGWFRIIAERHGRRSQEVIQARQIVDRFGQLFFPLYDALPARRPVAHKPGLPKLEEENASGE